MKLSKLLPLALVLAVGLAIVFLARSCDLGSKYAQEKAKYETYRALVRADAEVQARERAKQQALIEEKDREIATAHGKIDSLNGVLAVQEQTNSTLTEQAKLLKEQVQPVIDANPVLKAYVFNLTEQINNLNGMVFTLKQTVAEKDKIIGAWEQKFNAQVVISETWKKQYEGESSLRAMSEQMVKGLESRLKIERLKGRAWTVVAAVAGGYVVYSLVKK